MIGRRRLLEALAGAALAGCSGATPPPPGPPKPPAYVPTKVEHLTDLLPLADLRWLIVLRPREIAAIPWLIPPINKVVKEENFDQFERQNGLDLRQITEAAVARYEDAATGPSTMFLARHNKSPAAIEEHFVTRLVTGQHRAVDKPDVVRIAGKVGMTPNAMVLIGNDVVGLQSGGSLTRGPARIASLYAQGLLKKSPSALAEQPLRGLAERFGSAPATAFALGPFEGELARGARGLLAGATAIGASARPSAREGVLLAVAVAGDFSKSGDPASREAAAAWADLANSSFGHLLGLDQPIEKPLATFAPDAVAVAVEINVDKLAQGLAAATSARIDEIMK